MNREENELPSVLLCESPNSSISMVRSLKQIKDLLESVTPENESHEDRLNASIDDLEVMLLHIKH